MPIWEIVLIVIAVLFVCGWLGILGFFFDILFAILSIFTGGGSSNKGFGGGDSGGGGSNDDW